MNAEATPLRRGWTTGSCATAAAKAAWTALEHGIFPDPIRISLPSGQQVDFALAGHGFNHDGAWASVIKDAGDDPDVTHGALIRADIRKLGAEQGIVFKAGEGVGHITRPGLPLPPGEPAINPVPRNMMRTALQEVSGSNTNAEITISVPGGIGLAEKTLNSRLGIVGGLSILGTTGIVIPFSCSAWIDSIHRGIDVARALGLPHLAASTGNVSETAIQKFYGLPETALIEMGDFAGGVLKYVRKHPVPRLTIAGGIAKMTKLAQGRLDLHSGRSRADMAEFATLTRTVSANATLADDIAQTQTIAEAFLKARVAGVELGNHIARQALNVALDVLDDSATIVDVVLFDRMGVCVGRSELLSAHERKRLR